MDENCEFWCDTGEHGLVTHDAKVASKTERVLFMIDGKIEGEYNLGKLKKENKDGTQREQKLSEWLFKMDR